VAARRGAIQARVPAAQLFRTIKVYMKRKSGITKKNKRRGSAAAGTGEVLGVRMHPPQFVALDSWIAQQPDRPSRPEAVRRLLDFALAQLTDPNKQAAQKASEIAAGTADRLVDKSVPAEEQERRKQALIKGPKEFRDIREDLPMSSKGETD
jgi:hypothetical protein